MAIRQLTDIMQFFWMFESHHHQRLAWKDAAHARIARDRAEAQSQAQFHAMLLAHPSGTLGNAQLDDADKLKSAGLL